MNLSLSDSRALCFPHFYICCVLFKLLNLSTFGSSASVHPVKLRSNDLFADVVAAPAVQLNIYFIVIVF